MTALFEHPRRFFIRLGMGRAIQVTQQHIKIATVPGRRSVLSRSTVGCTRQRRKLLIEHDWVVAVQLSATVLFAGQ